MNVPGRMCFDTGQVKMAWFVVTTPTRAFGDIAAAALPQPRRRLPGRAAASHPMCSPDTAPRQHHDRGSGARYGQQTRRFCLVRTAHTRCRRSAAVLWRGGGVADSAGRPVRSRLSRPVGAGGRVRRQPSDRRDHAADPGHDRRRRAGDLAGLYRSRRCGPGRHPPPERRRPGADDSRRPAGCGPHRTGRRPAGRPVLSDALLGRTGQSGLRP